MLNTWTEKHPTRVFYGSPHQQKICVPKPNRRIQNDQIVFDDLSLHATPYKWIALAYTYNPRPYEIDGKTAHYNMGVSLYTNVPYLDIYGFDSLEESLEVLYGGPGYIHHFPARDFFHTNGLGDLEVISQKTQTPTHVETIQKPLDILHNLHVEFRWVNLAHPDNVPYRNYL